MAGILLNSTNYSGGGGQTIQKAELPVASAAEEGNIYQFIGETDDYIHGQFYECVEVDGSDPVEYEWAESEVEHELTAGEFAEIMTPLPGTPDEGVVIDLRGNERVIGKVIESDGTEKKLYEKTWDITTPSSSGDSVIITLPNEVDDVKHIDGFIHGAVGDVQRIPLNWYYSGTVYVNTYAVISDTKTIHQNVTSYTNKNQTITLRYTKTS